VGPGVNQFVFVAGVDYEFKGVDFRIFADNRVRRLIAGNTAKQDLRFDVYDVRRGELATTEVSYAGGKKAEKKAVTTPFRAVTKTSYDAVTSDGETHYHFKDGQYDVISVTDVYKAVSAIGTAAKHSLRELSFFAHGWMGGPILVNSFDDRTGHFTLPVVLGGPPLDYTVPSTDRDPDDKDPRPQLDFIAPTMDAAALKSFGEAFHADGFVWLWGCAFPRLIHQILHKIERNSAYRDSGLGDDVGFELTNMSKDEADVLERVLLPVTGAFPNRKKIQLEFKHIRHFVCRATQSCYAHQMASRTGIPTFSAVLGTYAEYDTGSLPLMHVYEGFAKHFTFYKNYLGFEFDPEGRRYGKHAPGFSCPVP
jgi:hypothetical protein